MGKVTVCPRCGRKFYGQSVGSHVWKCPVTAEELFWSRVDKNAPNGCWYFNGARDKWGYGDLSFHGKHVQAHRLAWRLLCGEPGHLDVLHKCHNPPCCNPDHLYLGTDADNTRDRVELRRHTFGEKNPKAKLTEKAVRIIRSEYRPRKNGVPTNSHELAARFGVGVAMIHAVIAGRNWKHVA